MLIPNINNYKIILASQSPRRKVLLQELGINAEIRQKHLDEDYPHELKREKIALFLANKKALAFNDIGKNEIIITADTIVWLKNKVLNKPEDRKEAVEILNEISGKCHQVYTAVCIRSSNKKALFSSRTDVYFRKLKSEEIDYYVDNYHPFDKAGAYGIQEWMGYVGVEKINGSFFNVMGLPVQRLYKEMNNFING